LTARIFLYQPRSISSVTETVSDHQQTNAKSGFDLVSWVEACSHISNPSLVVHLRALPFHFPPRPAWPLQRIYGLNGGIDIASDLLPFLDAPFAECFYFCSAAPVLG
jgi:hypothetical protein